MTRRPSETAANGGGRGGDGKFLPGNRAAKGNPYARKAAALRAALFKAVSASDLRAVVKQLVAQAKQGDVQAAKLLLERLLGPATAVDFEERLAALEAAVERPDSTAERIWHSGIGL
jgi:hypothetical protein